MAMEDYEHYIITENPAEIIGIKFKDDRFLIYQTFPATNISKFIILNFDEANKLASFLKLILNPSQVRR